SQRGRRTRRRDTTPQSSSHLSRQQALAHHTMGTTANAQTYAHAEAYFHSCGRLNEGKRAEQERIKFSASAGVGACHVRAPTVIPTSHSVSGSPLPAVSGFSTHT